MKRIAKIYLGLILSFTQSYSLQASASVSQKALNFQAAVTSEVFNQAQTLGQLLTNVEPLLTLEEVRGMKVYLEQKKMGLQTKLSRTKNVDNKIVFADGDEISFIDLDRVSYRGHQFSKIKALDRMLPDIEAALSSPNSRLELILPRAHASGTVAAVIAIALALGLVNVVYKSFYSEDAKISKLLQGLKISDCTTEEDVSKSALTFIFKNEPLTISVQEAEQKKIPAGTFQKLIQECMKQPIHSMSSAQIQKIIKSTGSTNPKSDAEALQTGVAK